METETNNLKIEFSFDDGYKTDIGIARTLKKFGFKAVFFIPTLQCELSEEEIIMLRCDLGMEIGGHTYSHYPDMKTLSKDICKEEVFRNKEWLEGLIGEKITKFCYPRGRYNGETIEVIKEAGYTEARTTIVLKTRVEDAFQKHTTIHFYPRNEYNGKDCFEYAKEYIENAKENQVIHFWGHSPELQRYYGVRRFREFVAWLAEQRDKARR